MASETLNGSKVAILVTDGFEQVEMTEPRKALDAGRRRDPARVAQGRRGEGLEIHGVGRRRSRWTCPSTAPAPEDFDALLLPGGVINPDKLRTLPKAVAFAKAFFDAGKPVASICHGPWTVIEAGAARGRRLTSWPSLKTDLENAGAEWVDQEVVVDQGLVTSRKPDDIPAFNREMIKLFASARGQSRQGAAE